MEAEINKRFVAKSAGFVGKKAEVRHGYVILIFVKCVIDKKEESI